MVGLRHTPSVRVGFALYLGYLVVFFTTWAINGVDYTRIGEDAQTTKLWYAVPTLLGCAFLFVAVTALGWWRDVLFDRTRCGPWWIWFLPAVVTLIIVMNFLSVDVGRLSPDLVLWLTLGGIGVGFGEEIATRGSLLVGLRSSMSERRAWLISTLSFAALHIPNALFGLPAAVMPTQVALTFIMGSALYVMRRMSGTLLLPIVLHGLWDSSLFAMTATGVAPLVLQFSVYPLAVVCSLAVLGGMKRALPEHHERSELR